MELSREDFNAVLIAEGGWGPVDRKIAEGNEGLFQCEKCSTKEHTVFHNARGEHRHVASINEIVNAEFGNF